MVRDKNKNILKCTLNLGKSLALLNADMNSLAVVVLRGKYFLVLSRYHSSDNCSNRAPTTYVRPANQSRKPITARSNCYLLVEIVEFNLQNMSSLNSLGNKV